jgi:hypothetical protein
MLKWLTIVLAGGAFLAAGLAVAGAEDRGGGRGSGFGAVIKSRMEGGAAFAPGFRAGHHIGGFRPAYGHAYHFPGYGYGYNYLDDGYDECEIDTSYGTRWPRCN